MIYPHVPETLDDSVELADWLELRALASHDQDASAGDLKSLLNIEGAGGVEDLLAQTFDEIDYRRTAASESYPFQTTGTSIRQTEALSQGMKVYIFCLILSYHGWTSKKGAKHNPWLLFEELSAYAAAAYVGGMAIVFGTASRDEGSSSFCARVDKLSKALREGGGYKKFPNVSVQDGKLDIVAWKESPDRRPSQLILVGQCAAGANWKSKLSELQPREGFWDNWMQDAPVSPLIRSFFVPHSIGEPNQWAHSARRGGIFFDRCRVAHHVEMNHSDCGDLMDRMHSCLQEHWSYDPP
jgi:hypothetical protein